MAIPLKEYEKIFNRRPRTGKGDEAELSQEDELALDRAWEKSRKRRAKRHSEENQLIERDLCEE